MVSGYSGFRDNGSGFLLFRLKRTLFYSGPALAHGKRGLGHGQQAPKGHQTFNPMLAYVGSVLPFWGPQKIITVLISDSEYGDRSHSHTLTPSRTRKQSNDEHQTQYLDSQLFLYRNWFWLPKSTVSLTQIIRLFIDWFWLPKSTLESWLCCGFCPKAVLLYFQAVWFWSKVSWYFIQVVPHRFVVLAICWILKSWRDISFVWFTRVCVWSS